MMIRRRAGFGFGFAGGATVYVGPGDVEGSAIHWWGLRAYSAATIGDNAVRLRRSTDDAEQDFVTLSDGSLDVASIATFKGAGNVFVKTLYDQPGGGSNLTQATNANQPQLLLSAIGSLPCISFASASSQRLASGSAVSVSEPFSVSSVAKADAASYMVYFGAGTEVLGILFAAKNTMYNGGVSYEVSLTGTDWSAIQDVWNGVSSFQMINTVDNGAANAGAGAISSQTIQLGNDGFSDFSNGRAAELGLWGSAFSGGQRTAMDANQRSYWGI